MPSESLVLQGIPLSASKLDDVWSVFGPHLVRDGAAPHIVERHREGLHIGREEVPVAVHRHRDRGVTQVDLDGFRVGSLGDEQRGTGVSQVVNPEPVGQPGVGNGLVPDLASSSPGGLSGRYFRCEVFSGDFPRVWPVRVQGVVNDEMFR